MGGPCGTTKGIKAARALRAKITTEVAEGKRRALLCTGGLGAGLARQVGGLPWTSPTPNQVPGRILSGRGQATREPEIEPTRKAATFRFGVPACDRTPTQGRFFSLRL